MSVERNRVPCGGSRAEDQAIYRQRVLVVALFNLSAGQRALASLTPHIGKIADAGGVRVVLSQNIGADAAAFHISE